MDLHNLLHLDWFRPPLCGHLLGHQPSAESLGPGNVMRLDEGYFFLMINVLLTMHNRAYHG
jgi:hypothetical protein